MIRKDMKSTEIKTGVIRRDGDKLIIEDINKYGEVSDTYTLDDIFDPYVDNEYVKIKVEYIKEVE